MSRRSPRAIKTAAIRADKAERGECRQCSKKCAKLKSGRLAKMCNDHLDADLKRKKAT